MVGRRATATFNNTLGGWVGSERETLSLAACTSTPNISTGTRLLLTVRETAAP